MGFIIILPLATLAGWAIFSITRWLRRGGNDRRWWRAFAILGGAGLFVGVWFAFLLEYKVANLRLDGFPIPTRIASREKPDSPWTTTTLPALVRFGGTVTNLLCGVALCLAPIAIALFFKENRLRRDASGNPLT